MNTNELLRQKAEHKAAAERLINSAMESGHDLQGADLDTYNGHIGSIRSIEALLQRHQELSSMSTPAVEAVAVINTENPAATDPRATAAYNKSFWAMMRQGRENVSREILAALSIGSDGVLVPTEFDKILVEKLLNQNVMRQVATVITTQSDRKIAVENAVGSADWAAENAVSHNDDGSDDGSFAQVTLSAFKLTRIQKVSEELLMDAFFDLPGYLARKFGNAFGLAEEAAFVAGNGTGKPSGVVAAATAGPTTASGVAIVADEVIATFHGLKRAYRSGASWLLNDSTALAIRKLKETTGQYIWQPGLQAGQPDMLLGKPVHVSDFVDSIAINKRALLFGDFSYYVIADRAPRTFFRLNELYAANGQVGFRGIQRTDGKLTLSEAVVALVQAAA